MFKRRKTTSLAKKTKKQKHSKQASLCPASPELILLCVLGGFVTAHGGPRDPDSGSKNLIWSERHVHSDLHHQL